MVFSLNRGEQILEGDTKNGGQKRLHILCLDMHKLATEQLAHLHKTPAEKAQVVINFLKFSSYETLQAFKVNDRY